jgi:hypothetical protein
MISGEAGSSLLRVSPCDITMSVVQRCPVNIGAAIAHHTRTSGARQYFFEFWNFYLRCRHGESATGWKWKLSIFLNHCIFFLTVFVFFVGRIHPGQYYIIQLFKHFNHSFSRISADLFYVRISE